MQSLICPTMAIAASVAIVAAATSMPTSPLLEPLSQRAATQADTLLTATLTGSETVGRSGPPNASGRAIINLRLMSSEVCYNVVFRGLVGTQAHIHKGAKGQNGPVSVPFAIPKDSTTAGCAKVDATLLTDIGTNPANYYINVHTAELPQGAIRGQLGKALARGGG